MERQRGNYLVTEEMDAAARFQQAESGIGFPNKKVVTDPACGLH